VHAGIIPKGLEDFSNKFRRDRVFEVVEEKIKRVSILKHLKRRRSKVVLQVNRFCEGKPRSICRSSQEKKQTVRIPYREFTKSREPSDLAEE
jgi:hypothetical protein